MIRSERARPSRNSRAGLRRQAIRPRRAATPRQRQPARTRQAEFVVCKQTISELFGYEKGAFTGATARRCGHIEHAQGGTLFLDEIGDMPLDLQGYLLRFLQEGEIVRVGGRKPIKVDARVITATNVPLRAAITAGKLREDLFYRMNVLTLHLPPLRERTGDAEVLATYLLRKIERELGHDSREFAPSAMAAICEYSWPGNIREMIATLRRAVVLARGERIEASDLRLEPDRAACRPAAVQARARRTQAIDARPEPGSPAEREAILSALAESRNNVTRAAEAIGVSRVTFYRMLRRSQIELPPHARSPLTEPAVAK